jgi:hypothetical protein
VVSWVLIEEEESEAWSKLLLSRLLSEGKGINKKYRSRWGSPAKDCSGWCSQVSPD